MKKGLVTKPLYGTNAPLGKPYARELTGNALPNAFANLSVCLHLSLPSLSLSLSISVTVSISVFFFFAFGMPKAFPLFQWRDLHRSSFRINLVVSAYSHAPTLSTRNPKPQTLNRNT